jgi:ABC-type uncharacterized transport system permease subunit
MRRTHRWTSCVFTATVIANFVALAITGGAPPHWAITYAPLAPLLVLMISGTWMFVRPYLGVRRAARHSSAN